MGKPRRRPKRHVAEDVVAESLESALAEREINALVPGTSSAKARQFVHVRNGLLVALLQDPRTLETLGRWRAEMTEGKDFAERIAREGRTLVCDTLGLSWPWLAYALLEVFWRSIETREEEEWSAIAYEADLFAPRMSLHWRTKPGESINEASARLTGLFERAQKALKRATTEWRSRERMKSSAEALMRAGYWWYLVNVSKPRIGKAEIARTFLPDARDARRTVQLEIARVQQLLDEVPAAVYPSAR
jgi:hypothetical protein